MEWLKQIICLFPKWLKGGLKETDSGVQPGMRELQENQQISKIQQWKAQTVASADNQFHFSSSLNNNSTNKNGPQSSCTTCFVCLLYRQWTLSAGRCTASAQPLLNHNFRLTLRNIPVWDWKEAQIPGRAAAGRARGSKILDPCPVVDGCK